MKQVEHELGKTCHNSLVVDGTEHAHIGGNGVEGMGSTNEILLIESQNFRRDVVEQDYITTKILTERANGITIKVGCRKAATTS